MGSDTTGSGESTSSTSSTGVEEPVEVWTYTHDGEDSGDDEVRGVTVDGEGNVYAAGLETAGGTTHAWAIRLDPGGREVWTYTGSNPGTANAIALLPAGDVVIAGGATLVADQQLDIVVTRLTGDAGTEVWTETHDYVLSAEDEAHGVAVDSDGDIVVVGREGRPDGFGVFWTRKYGSGGAEQWTQTFWFDFGLDHAALGVAIDGADGITAVGYGETGVDGPNAVLVHYDAAGEQVWAAGLGKATFQDFRAVAYDAEDDYYAVGRVGDDVLSIVVRKYDDEAVELWSATHLEADGPDDGRSVAIDADGNAYVAGSVNAPGQSSDVWGRKYGSKGDELWSIAYGNEDAALDDVANAIAVDADGNVIVAGFETTSSRNAWIRKYSQE